MNWLAVTRRSGLAILFALVITGCKPGGTVRDLGNGYEFWIMNSEEHYVANPDRELISGPKIRAVAIAQQHLIVEIRSTSDARLFDVIDMQTSTIASSLGEAELRERFGIRPDALRFQSALDFPEKLEGE